MASQPSSKPVSKRHIRSIDNLKRPISLHHFGPNSRRTPKARTGTTAFKDNAAGLSLHRQKPVPSHRKPTLSVKSFSHFPRQEVYLDTTTSGDSRSSSDAVYVPPECTYHRRQASPCFVSPFDVCVASSLLEYQDTKGKEPLKSLFAAAAAAATAKHSADNDDNENSPTHTTTPITSVADKSHTIPIARSHSGNDRMFSSLRILRRRGASTRCDQQEGEEDDAAYSFRIASSSSQSGMSEITFTPEQRNAVPRALRQVDTFVRMANDTARDYGFGLVVKAFIDEQEPQQYIARNSWRDSFGSWILDRIGPASLLWKKPRHNGDSDIDRPRVNSENNLTHVLYLSPRSQIYNSIEDMYRLSGTGTFDLPSQLQSVNLIVPLGIAAAANFLVQNKSNVHGIFQAPATDSVVKDLKQHYDAPVEANRDTSDYICVTIASPDIPPHISATPLDIGWLFKKFLVEIPGGVLGSVSLFKTLEKIRTATHTGILLSPDELDIVKYRLIALTLLSIKSHHRLAVICGLFGLLSHLTVDADARQDEKKSDIEMDGSTDVGKEDDTVPARLLEEEKESFEPMTAKTLAQIFGPVLLCRLLDDIPLGKEQPKRMSIDGRTGTKSSRRDRRQSYGSPRRSAFLRPFSKLLITESEGECKHRRFMMKTAKAQVAMNLCEYMVKGWRCIAGQMRQIQPYSPPSSTTIRPSHHARVRPSVSTSARHHRRKRRPLSDYEHHRTRRPRSMPLLNNDIPAAGDDADNISVELGATEEQERVWKWRRDLGRLPWPTFPGENENDALQLYLQCYPRSMLLSGRAEITTRRGVDSGTRGQRQKQQRLRTQQKTSPVQSPDVIHDDTGDDTEGDGTGGEEDLQQQRCQSLQRLSTLDTQVIHEDDGVDIQQQRQESQSESVQQSERLNIDGPAAEASEVEEQHQLQEARQSSWSIDGSFQVVSALRHNTADSCEVDDALAESLAALGEEEKEEKEETEALMNLRDEDDGGGEEATTMNSTSSSFWGLARMVTMARINLR